MLCKMTPYHQHRAWRNVCRKKLLRKKKKKKNSYIHVTRKRFDDVSLCMYASRGDVYAWPGQKANDRVPGVTMALWPRMATNGRTARNAVRGMDIPDSNRTRHTVTPLHPWAQKKTAPWFYPWRGNVCQMDWLKGQCPIHSPKFRGLWPLQQAASFLRQS